MSGLQMGWIAAGNRTHIHTIGRYPLYCGGRRMIGFMLTFGV